MQTAILGGAFNPIHLAHLFLAEELVKELNFKKVIFIPSYLSAHKVLAEGASPQARLEMCRLACEDSPYFLVDDCEIKRAGISYTIDTLKDLHQRYSFKEKPYLIIGDDLADGFPSWKDSAQIMELAQILIAHRVSEKELPFCFPHLYFANRIFPLSSSEIRKRLKEGKAVRYLLPEKVYRYIDEQKLYR